MIIQYTKKKYKDDNNYTSRAVEHIAALQNVVLSFIVKKYSIINPVMTERK